MTHEFDSFVASPDRIATRQVIVLDWFDGPREAICALTEPSVEFVAKLLDERSSIEDADLRVFRVMELDLGTTAAIVKALSFLGEPANPVWIPSWRPQDARLSDAEDLIKEALIVCRPTNYVLMTRDLVDFLGCWEVSDFPEDRDWFRFLGV